MIRFAFATTCLAFLFAVSADAQIREYEFQGTITAVNPSTQTVIWTETVNSPFTVTMIVDAGAAPTSAGSTFAVYQGLMLSAEVEIDGVTLMLPSIPTSGAETLDDDLLAGMCSDRFHLTASVANPNASFIEIDFNKTSAVCPSTSMSGVGLPPVVIPSSFGPSNFVDRAAFRMISPGSGIHDGVITNVTVTDTTPANDDCANATSLPAMFATTPFDATGATTDGTDLAGFCDLGPFGDDQISNDVWFTYTPAVGGCTYISTFGLAGYDTRLAVYNSPNCPEDPAAVLACVDDELFPSMSPFEAGLDVQLVAGATYLIRLGTFNAGSPAGTGLLRVAAGPGADVNSGGNNPGAPSCIIDLVYIESCNGDGGNQMGCSNCPCMNNASPGTAGGCTNSAGSSTRLIASHDASVSLPSGDITDLRFGLIGAPNGAFCILNSGDAVAPGNMANMCFGMNSGVQSIQFDGLRCAIMNTRRHGGRSANSNGEVGVTSNPWGGEGGPPAGIANAGGGFVAGQTRYFQVIHRDDPLLVCMRGLNSSQAVEVTFVP